MSLMICKAVLWILLTALCVEFVATLRNRSYAAQVQQRCARPAEYYVEVVEPKLRAAAAAAEPPSPATAPAR